MRHKFFSKIRLCNTFIDSKRNGPTKHDIDTIWEQSGYIDKVGTENSKKFDFNVASQDMTLLDRERSVAFFKKIKIHSTMIKLQKVREYELFWSMWYKKQSRTVHTEEMHVMEDLFLEPAASTVSLITRNNITNHTPSRFPIILSQLQSGLFDISVEKQDIAPCERTIVDLTKVEDNFMQDIAQEHLQSGLHKWPKGVPVAKCYRISVACALNQIQQKTDTLTAVDLLAFFRIHSTHTINNDDDVFVLHNNSREILLLGWLAKIVDNVRCMGYTLTKTFPHYPPYSSPHPPKKLSIFMDNMDIAESIGSFMELRDWQALRTTCTAVCAIPPPSTVHVTLCVENGSPDFKLTRDKWTTTCMLGAHCANVRIIVGKQHKDNPAKFSRAFYTEHTNRRSIHISTPQASAQLLLELLYILRTQTGWYTRCDHVQELTFTSRGKRDTIQDIDKMGIVLSTVLLMFPALRTLQIYDSCKTPYKPPSGSLLLPLQQQDEFDTTVQAMVNECDIEAVDAVDYRKRVTQSLAGIQRLSLPLVEHLGHEWIHYILNFTALNDVKLRFFSGLTLRTSKIFAQLKNIKNRINVSFGIPPPSFLVPVSTGKAISIPQYCRYINIDCADTSMIAAHRRSNIDQHIIIHSRSSTSPSTENKRILNSADGVIKMSLHIEKPECQFVYERS
jgi:hypothetical protein